MDISFLSSEIDGGTDEKQDIYFYWPNNPMAITKNVAQMCWWTYAFQSVSEATNCMARLVPAIGCHW